MNQSSLAKICSRFGVEDVWKNDAVANYGEARRRFETFAALDAPHLPRHDCDAAQVQLARWQVRNFGAPNGLHLALGVCEEFGELAEATERADVEDAIGDVQVYACQLATLHRLAWSEVALNDLRVGTGPAISISGKPGVAQGLLAHVTLKAAQGIRGLDESEAARFATYLALSGVVDSLHRFGFDTWETFQKVAARVMERDWTANKATGGAA